MTESARVKELEKELAKVTEERDLAIAHDRQPYPTQWAYDQACKALEKAKVDRDAQAALVERMRGSLSEIERIYLTEMVGTPCINSQAAGSMFARAHEALAATPSSALQEFKERCWLQGAEAAVRKHWVIPDFPMAPSAEAFEGEAASIVAELKKEGR